MNVVMIHQPHFLPWLGYFNKLLNIDHFIILDDVQYRPRYYQNRTKILCMSGAQLWLSVPVSTDRNTMINDTKIAKVEWKEKTLETIRYSYGKADYFHESWKCIQNCLMPDEKSLLSLNIRTLKLILKMLTNKEVSFSLSSSYRIVPKNPTDRLIKLCKAVGATHYLFGEGNGINYHNPMMFLDNNIKIIQQSFSRNHPVYKQQIPGFVPGLSIIDALFNIGSKNTYTLTEKAWKI
jgi:hypothetical protein